MTQFDLTDEQREIQDLARRFTADRITPFAAEWDEKHIFPRDTIREAAELGFAAIYVSEESGGIALGRLEAALIMEAMAYGCPSTSAFISIHNMASWMIDRFGDADVKGRYLPDLVTIINIGVQKGIIGPTLFSMLVLMAIVTTMMASPLFELVYGRKARVVGEMEALGSAAT